MTPDDTALVQALRNNCRWVGEKTNPDCCICLYCNAATRINSLQQQLDDERLITRALGTKCTQLDDDKEYNAECWREQQQRLEALATRVEWQPIETAPKDGTAILGFGLHSGPQPDAQRGVKAGDYWWAIMLWDIWRNPDPAGWGEQSLWVFAKDGKPTWSFPTHWMPLPDPPKKVTP